MESLICLCITAICDAGDQDPQEGDEEEQEGEEGGGKGRGEPAAGARETVLSNQAVDASYL
jgi:hypothetical protein